MTSLLRHWLLRFFGAVVVVATVASCASGPADVVGVEAPDRFAVTLEASGFVGPTQMVFAPNGDLVIAELNGGENDATGRVLRAQGPDFADYTVLQEQLDKPTGIAVVDDRLWIMERNRLSVTSLSPGAERQVIADDLPSNGRSEGTLTVTPDGSLLYNTSGSKRGPDRVAGSGTLFSIANAGGDFEEATVVATGFKHAYAHVVDNNDQLWTVEMTDGNFDGERAPDELVAIASGDDGGWPQCVGDNRVVVEFDGTDELCSQSPPSHAILGLGATPTSLVLAPWDDTQFVIALWLPGEVVTVPRSPGDVPHAPTTFITGIESPQHLLVDGERLLVSDHATGQIFAVTPTE